MKRKNFVVFLVSIIVLFQFSPAIGYANEANIEEEVEEVNPPEDQNSEEGTSDNDSDNEKSEDTEAPAEESDTKTPDTNEESSNDTVGVEEKEENIVPEEEPTESSNTSVEEEKQEEEEVKIETFSAPTASIPFENGDSHEDIADIKEKLNAIGFDGISITNNFGNWTETRVREFQKYYGLTVDGKIGPATLEKIDSVYNSPFRLGERHDDTIEIKEKLNQLGYGHITVTTLYGSFTEQQVRKFQNDNGLKVNGIADEVTLAKLNELASSTNTFELGDRHDTLISIKQKLNAIGFDRISETNYFGNWTETRVEQFQDYYGLTVDGKIGQTTLEKIDSVYNSPFQLGERHEDTVALKEMLNQLGYGYITVTTLYGNFTEQQVKKFQEDYGLRVNGIADEKTLTKLEELASTDTFELGDRHNALISFKQKLNAIGFDGISETNYFGNWTQTRVTQFQEYYGLTANGTLDQTTQEKLNEVYETPFKLGERHEDTVELKEKLNRLGYGYITVTTLYGSFTEQQVKKFQEDSGLRVSGIADEVTWDLLNDLVAETGFILGDRHNDIIELKKQLNAIGFDRISETNYFGDWTETRVEQFQEYYGLTVNGKLDQTTQSKLNEVYESPFQLGKRHEETVELKEKLNQIGFGYITVTNLYGEFTETQVKKFQDYYGLRVNGIVDGITRLKINEVYNSPLQQGNRNSQVIDLKEKLNALGYDGISLTNYFGNWTETRLKQFQADNNLRVSGIADEVTLSVLEKVVSEQVVKIFLDPGHGDHDPGGQGYGLNEKYVVLDIALKTADFLTNDYEGVEVELSRTNDTFVELTERANLANNWGADYFVSFHTNAFDGSASGFETYIYNGSVSQETRDRQRDIHSYISNRINVNDRGMQTANFNVLRNTQMPAILLEYMFIDNLTENIKLKSDSYRTTLAQITADAIADSFNLKRR